MEEQEGTSAQEVRMMGEVWNRTGLLSSSEHRAMEENTERCAVRGTETQFRKLRRDARREQPPVGTMPPPPSLTGAARQALRALTGEKTTVLLDKLGERLAFERTGTRLYDTLLEKLEISGGFDGGPLREDLERFRQQEHAHALMLIRVLEELDADPTTLTPSADLAATASLGVVQVVSDARTDLGESLEAMLIAELTDTDGWTHLAALARQLGYEELAAKCEEAEAEERIHLDAVRRWVTARTARKAG